jgi:ribonuclease HI
MVVRFYFNYKGKNPIAGIGVYFKEDNNKNISKKINNISTNNQAGNSYIIYSIIELMAIYEGIKNSNDDDNLIIHTDSEYSIKGILNLNKRIKNIQIFELIDDIIKKRRGKVIFKKVTGHSGEKDGNYFGIIFVL